MKLLALALAGIASPCLAIPAFAGSDGAYCSGNGYIAYDLREGLTPGVKGHVVRILRFDSRRGIYPAGEETLVDFQVHQMVCTGDRIEMVGWRKGFERYVLTVNEPQGLTVSEHTADPARQFDYKKEPPDTPVLWYGKPGKVPLNASDPQHHYELVLGESSKEVPQGMEYRRTAEVVQLDPQGRILQHLLIYEKRRTEGGE